LARPLAVAGCLILLFSLSPMGGERLEELSSTRSLGSVSGGITTNSLDWRFFNWFELIKVWRDSPFFGHGLGSTIEVVQPGRNLPHNEYVRYLVEIGVVGTLLALLGLLRGLRWLNHQRQRASAPAHMLAANLAWALVVFLLVQALAANTLLYTSSIYVGLTAIGALIVLSRDRPQDIEAEAHRERPHPIPLRAASRG
jgi:O-antigen ligase